MTYQAQTEPAGFPPSAGGITVLENPGAIPVEDRVAASAFRPEALVGAILRAANTHYERNNVAAACDFLTLLDHCNAHTAETLQTLGNLSFLLGDDGPAAAAYQRALTLAPAHAGLWVSLALTSRRLKAFPTMQAALKRALDLEPGNPEALKLLADELRDQNHYQEAAHIYGGLVQRDPRHIDNCLSLAKCFFETGDKATAESTLEYVLQLEPNNQLVRENLASLQGQGRPSSGMATPPLLPASELPPVAAEYLTRADAAYTRGDLPGACELLGQVLANAPQFVPAWLCLGNLQFQLEQYPAALESYRIAQTLDPEAVDLLVRLAAAALRCQDIPGFEQALGRALELDANHVGALRLLADLNLQSQRFVDAARGYRQIVQQTPQDTDVLMALGRCEFEMGALAAARSAFQEALEVNPSLKLAQENLAVVNEMIALAAARPSDESAKTSWSEFSAKLQLAGGRAYGGPQCPVSA